MPITLIRYFNSFYNFQRSLKFFCRFQHTFLTHNLKVVKCRDDECDDFLPWLEKKAGMEISSLLSIGKSEFGRSLFACKNIQAGDCILKVPFNVQISVDNMPSEIKYLLDFEVGTTTKLAVIILHEQRKARDSEWAPYVTRLPLLGELHSTIFWSESELKMIQQCSIYEETIDQKAQIRKDYQVIKSVFDRFPDLFEGVMFEDFQHAYGLVGSRAWESMKGLSLIPFADFLNHDGTSESVVLSDEDKQVSEVIADRDYDKGEEVHIQLDIPHDDPLRAMKLDLLHKHCLPKVKDSSFTSGGGSFIIKKVKSSRGKGKGIPLSLRAFARVLCCTSSQELNYLAMEAAQNDGRLARNPLIDGNKEINSHQLLLSEIDELIERYNMSIKSLWMLRSTNSSTASIRQKMARDLLCGEIEVLRSASAWLKNYCYSLTSLQEYQSRPSPTPKCYDNGS